MCMCINKRGSPVSQAVLILCVVEDDLELLISLVSSLPPEYWDYKHGPLLPGLCITRDPAQSLVRAGQVLSTEVHP